LNEHFEHEHNNGEIYGDDDDDGNDHIKPRGAGKRPESTPIATTSKTKKKK